MAFKSETIVVFSDILVKGRGRWCSIRTLTSSCLAWFLWARDASRWWARGDSLD